MNLYSHAVLAWQLQNLVQPNNPDDYLWGAVAPDIRYLAGMRRQTTHLPDTEISIWFSRYPDYASFIQGYRVHCMLDAIDTARVLGRVAPFSWVQWLRRKPFGQQQTAAVIELYYHRRFPQGLRLVGGHNPVLADLGVAAEQSRKFSSVLASYLSSPSFETALESFTRLGLVDDGRIQKYVRAYRSIQNPLLLRVLVSGVKRAGLENGVQRCYHEMVSGCS